MCRVVWYLISLYIYVSTLTQIHKASKKKNKKGPKRTPLLVMATPRQVLHNSIYSVLKFSYSFLSTPMEIWYQCKKKTKGSRTNSLVFYFLHICSFFGELNRTSIRYESAMRIRFQWFIWGKKNQESEIKKSPKKSPLEKLLQ